MVTAAGFLGLEALEPRSSLLTATGAMVVIGLGLGLLLQNLVLVVQSGVPSRTLSVATSSTHFLIGPPLLAVAVVACLLIPEGPPAPTDARRGGRDLSPEG